ncbi:hypothetical protein TRAPUB_12456 [Trametes pubescens]|uniref:Uncharacterized protein n=1 Tax=Trametes pubescens TaxID=154538 RepID=A0A1M2VU27_TRAPU|nr:hypothetical protein TRAPUB_12456 [Trametes pubescens]
MRVRRGAGAANARGQWGLGWFADAADVSGLTGWGAHAGWMHTGPGGERCIRGHTGQARDGAQAVGGKQVRVAGRAIDGEHRRVLCYDGHEASVAVVRIEGWRWAQRRWAAAGGIAGTCSWLLQWA